MISGNRGEWSEIYVLFKLLSDGKIFAADSELNKLNDIFFPIIKVIRKENPGEIKEYKTGETVEIYVNNNKVKSVSKGRFEEEASLLIEEIKNSKGSSFNIHHTEEFMEEILCYKLSAPATKKSDITMEIIDINTGYSPTVGFSIKSELGSSPTLLNASKSTNFIYKINHKKPFLVEETNKIFKFSKGKQRTDVRGRIKNIIKQNSDIEYSNIQSKIFKDNLVLVDSSMDQILAKTVLYFYKEGITNCLDLVSKLESENPMNFGNINAYRYKFKKFLTAIALGMKPATVWDGIDEANGGYIIVTKQGDVLAYHIYNRNYFEEYLLKNTKYETASTSRHRFGEIYTVNNEDFIKLNLQIRFK